MTEGTETRATVGGNGAEGMASVNLRLTPASCQPRVDACG